MSDDRVFRVFLDDKFYGSFSYSDLALVVCELECKYPDSSIFWEVV